MQSNRTVGLILFLVLLIAGAIGWQLLGSSELPQVPGQDQTTKSDNDTSSNDAEAATHQDSDGEPQPASEATAKREAVEAPDPAVSDLPSIVGQVVGPAGRGVEDVEIICTPGFDIGSFADMDLGDTNPFDSQAIIKRAAGDKSQRVVTRTDADGSFRLHSEGTSKTVRLRVQVRGHLLINRNVSRPIDSDTDVGVLTLEVGAIVTGRVVDASGNAVASARVTRIDPDANELATGLSFAFSPNNAFDTLRGGDSSVTDEAGRFELAHLAAGSFSLRARHQDFPTATRSELSANKGHSVADILITMPRSATIRGTVSDLPQDRTGLLVMASEKRTASKDPTGGLMGMLGDASELLGDMGFSYGERQCEIASDGKFVLQGLNAESTYRVWVAQQGQGFAGSGMWSNRVEARTDTSGVTLRYQPGVRVTFTVVDSKSGAPIERLWVRDQLRGGGGLGDMMAFAPNNSRQKPYPEGLVTVANLRAKKKQKLQLTIQAIGYRSFEQKDIELPATGSLDLGTLRLDPQPVLHVTVLNAYHGKPIGGARVKLASEQAGGRFAAMAQMGGRGATPQSGSTDSEGTCTINALVDQAAELTVTQKGFAPATVTVSGSADDSLEHVVRLVEGGTVAVTVLDPDKNPVEGVNIEHRTPENQTDTRRTDANGVARFANLSEDLHEFRVAATRAGEGFAARFGNRGANDAGEPWQSVDVLDQETAELTLSKSPSATLTGIVRENGVPLEDAKVTFQKGQASDNSNEAAMSAMMGLMTRGGSNDNKSDEEGLYSLSGLPSGNHRVRITHKDRAMPSTVMVTLRDGENRFDIDLSMTTLLGVVRDANGTPVSGAEVTVSQQRAGDNEQAGQVGRMMAGMMGGMGLGGKTLKTNGQGEFKLRGVAADIELAVRVTAKSLTPTTATATVALGQTKGPIQLTMQPAGRIEVTLTKTEMFSAVQATFVDDGTGKVEPVMQVLRGKKGFLEGLRPGNWEVAYLSMQNRNPESAPKTTVTVIAGQTATVSF
ncbi:MAG: protocatechuate 3,4-dioxygenase beta subunit [Planctomycetota bacterium]|jgi:protocatechuate 3,4-dioxygenase beta subunit